MTGLLTAALTASTRANRLWQRRPALQAPAAVRCSDSGGSTANGAAGGIAAALVLMQAARLLPGWTWSAAPPVRAPIPTAMVVSASVASVLVRCCSRHYLSTSGLLLLCADCRRCVHHMQAEADDVTRLLIAALTASTFADRPWQRRRLLHTCHAVLWQLF